MEAGRELDALVAEKVMGWKTIEDGRAWSCSTCGKPFYGEYVPLPYSTDIAAAWQVVEKNPTLFKLQYDYISDMWDARFESEPEYAIQAITAPHAICMAALKAIGVSVE